MSMFVQLYELCIYRHVNMFVHVCMDLYEHVCATVCMWDSEVGEEETEAVLSMGQQQHPSISAATAHPLHPAQARADPKASGKAEFQWGTGGNKISLPQNFRSGIQAGKTQHFRDPSCF